VVLNWETRSTKQGFFSFSPYFHPQEWTFAHRTAIALVREIYYYMSAKYSLTDAINKRVDTMVMSIMEEVKKEGRKEGYKEIAIRLLGKGFDIDSISTITGLSKQCSWLSRHKRSWI
jgi:hypothetical protein